MNPGANAALSDHVYKDPLPEPKAIVTIAGTEYRVLASLTPPPATKASFTIISNPKK